MRGLIKTYGLSSDLAQVVQMRENVAAVWALFVDGAADEGDACVTREAFLRPVAVNMSAFEGRSVAHVSCSIMHSVALTD